MPRSAVVTGGGDRERAAAHIEVVPGHIHPPEEGRGWVVVRPTRLAVVAGTAVVNARIMDPAIRVPRCAGLVAAQATAALTVEDPDREPLPAYLVIENNGVTQGIVEGALTVGPGKAGEGQTAVGRGRCTGDVDGIGIDPSRVVEGHHYHIGVIGVGRSVRF